MTKWRFAHLSWNWSTTDAWIAIYPREIVSQSWLDQRSDVISKILIADRNWNFPNYLVINLDRKTDSQKIIPELLDYLGTEGWESVNMTGSYIVGDAWLKQLYDE